MRVVNLSDKKGKSGIERFLESLDSTDSFTFKTSGSTGTPKKLKFTKEQLEKSAKQTAKAFDLNEKSILLCPLSPSYVAGRMMLVRAWYLDAELVYTDGVKNPFEIAGSYKITFAAFVPLQLENMLADGESIEWLNSMKTIIVGGAPVHDNLLESIREKLTVPVYQTYGMTETLTHVAIRRLNGAQASEYYKPLSGVKLGVDDSNCLKLKSPVTEGWMQTNDVVELKDEGFAWIGRKDFIINSGGHKISPEKVESYLVKKLGIVCAVVGLPNQQLGEKAVLAIEGFQSFLSHAKLTELLKDAVHAYEIPKEVVLVSRIPRLKNEKMDRLALKKMLT